MVNSYWLSKRVISSSPHLFIFSSPHLFISSSPHLIIIQLNKAEQHRRKCPEGRAAVADEGERDTDDGE